MVVCFSFVLNHTVFFVVHSKSPWMHYEESTVQCLLFLLYVPLPIICGWLCFHYTPCHSNVRFLGRLSKPNRQKNNNNNDLHQQNPPKCSLSHSNIKNPFNSGTKIRCSATHFSGHHHSAMQHTTNFKSTDTQFLPSSFFVVFFFAFVSHTNIHNTSSKFSLSPFFFQNTHYSRYFSIENFRCRFGRED